MQQDIYMKATTAVKNAVIDGHTYDVPKEGVIKLVNPNHVATLRRHNFIDHFIEAEDAAEKIDAMDDKDELVKFIEERGGDADNSMKLTKLRKLAHQVLEG